MSKGRAILAAFALLTAAPIATAPPAVANLSVDHGIVYARPGGVSLKLDAYLPQEPGLHLGIIVLHGGAWSSGSRSDIAYEGQWFADRGFAAFVIDYRLAPAYRYPAALDDAQAAVRWVRTHAKQFGVDPRALEIGRAHV